MGYCMAVLTFAGDWVCLFDQISVGVANADPSAVVMSSSFRISSVDSASELRAASNAERISRFAIVQRPAQLAPQASAPDDGIPESNLITVVGIGSGIFIAGALGFGAFLFIFACIRHRRQMRRLAEKMHLVEHHEHHHHHHRHRNRQFDEDEDEDEASSSY